MAKKPNLLQAMKTQGRQPETAAPEALPAASAPENKDPHYRPGRAGATNITGYYPKAVKKQLRTIAVEHDTTIADCLAEAINDLFAKYGKPEIAPRKPKQ